MKPGRELDALVAEKVFNQTSEWREKARGGCLCGRGERCSVCSFPLPYSTDIAEAWEVVEKLKALPWQLGDDAGVRIRLEWCPSTNKWEVRIQNKDFVIEYGTSAPHAICLAALKAVGA